MTGGLVHYQLIHGDVELSIIVGEDETAGGALLWRPAGIEAWAERSLAPLEFQLLRALCMRACLDLAGLRAGHGEHHLRARRQCAQACARGRSVTRNAGAHTHTHTHNTRTVGIRTGIKLKQQLQVGKVVDVHLVDERDDDSARSGRDVSAT